MANHENMLPRIMQILCNKPKFCETVKQLSYEIQQSVALHPQDIHHDLKKALDVGKRLGIIIQNDEMIRVPFNIYSTEKRKSLPIKIVKNYYRMAGLKKNLEQNQKTYKTKCRKSMVPKRCTSLLKDEMEFYMIKPIQCQNRKATTNKNKGSTFSNNPRSSRVRGNRMMKSKRDIN